MSVKFKSIIKDILGYVFTFILIIIFLSFFRGAVVNGSSMENTFSDGDYLMLKVTKDVKYGDIVAIDSEDLETILCKRVIGSEGDTVKIKDGILYLNNKEVAEPYIKEKNWGTYTEDLEYTVSKGKVFVMGDNRNNSLDSRELGLLDVDDIQGVYLFNITGATGLDFRTFRLVVIIAWVIFCVYIILNKKHSNKSKNDKSNEKV